MRYVLLLQSDKASAFAMGRSRFGAAVIFNNDSAGQESFSRYLQEREHSLFSIVLDSKDEEHHLDSIPKLGRSDQRRLLEKMSTRHFPGNILSAITIEKNKHPVDSACSVTLSGLPQGNDCEAWLKLLSHGSALMIGISSLSLLGLEIHRASGNHTSLCALQIAQNDFRLLAYHNSRLIICRHLQVTDDLAADLTDQLRQTQQYLDSLPLLVGLENTPDAPTDTVNSKDSQLFKGVQVVGALSVAARTELERAGASVIGCAAMSRMLGIRPEVSAPFSGMLFAALALNKESKQVSFSMGSYKNSFLARRLRHVFYAGSLACLGVTAAATAAAVHYNGTYTSLITESTTHNVEAQVADLPLLVSSLGVDVPIDTIRDSMRIAQYLSAKTQSTPLHFLSSLATDLTEYPQLKISEIQWSRAADDYSLALSDQPRGVQGNVSGTYYSATLTGYLEMHPPEKKEALRQFNSFILALRATELYDSVTVVEAPSSGSSSSSLSTNNYVMASSLPPLKESFVIEFSSKRGLQ